MYPHEFTYPLFEANQVLKKDDLNNLFEYLDEQNRMTRTNLIGIGIVCGMDIIPTTANKIKITKGVGVTSEGYLVTIPEVEYTNYKVYPPNIDIFLGDDCYTETHKIGKNTLQKFVEGAAPNNNQLSELVEGTPTGSSPLTATFLADKIVLVYVELSKNGLRNCSPNSCDDKGTEISVTFRRFLVTKANADIIKKEASDLVGTQSNVDIEKIIEAKLLLPDIRLRRFDVPNSNPVTTSDIIAAYQKILTKTFIEGTLRTNLVKIFEVYESILTGLDKTVVQNWAGTYSGATISLAKPYEYQYFYDFISDLIQNYQDIRAKGFEVLALCNPDCRMFPRHLFLGEATVDTSKNRSVYRQYFIPSPIIGNQKKIGDELRLLFERMLGLIQRYKIPQPVKLGIVDRILDANIRITPSKLGDISLSKKSIPYYYEVNAGTPKLFETWNYNLKNQGKEKQNLSYHANQYANSTDDFVLNPLEYDLESFNFLRIEGIVGKPYQDVMAAVNQYIQLGRLPFDVVALSTGNESLNIETDPADFQCHFADLEVIYDVQRHELECLVEEQRGDTRFEPLIDLFPPNLSDFTTEVLKEIRRILVILKLTEENEAIKCKIEILEGLLSIYRKRIAKLKADFIFSNYTKKNPGIQHKAGVPMGGTFIIVYHGSIKSYHEKEESIGVREVAVNDDTIRIRMATTGAAEAAASEVGEKKYVVQEQNVLGLSAQLLNEIENLPSAIQAEIVKVIEDKVASVLNTTEDVDIDTGIVFADFYLPYRCCADCTPVQVVQPPKPTQLAATVSAPKCDESNKNFTVTISISGGTPPYTSDTGSVVGNAITVTLQSGNGQSVNIKDANNQQITVAIPAHECEQPCDLPCKGIAERCFYPVWVSKPSKGTKVTMQFVEVAVLKFTDTETGKNFEFDFRESFKAQFSEYDDSSYIQAVESVIKTLNEVAEQDIGNDKTFIIGFDQEKELLTVEHYVCHTFSIELNWGYSIEGKTFTNKAEYNENSWAIDTNGDTVKGGKFGCVDLDKCKGVEEERCKTQLDSKKIKLSLKKTGEKYTYDFESSVTPDFILWIFETEKPEYSNSKRGTFVSNLGSVKVKLIFVKGPCFVIVEGVAPNEQ